jgi:hypothetical protein
VEAVDVEKRLVTLAGPRGNTVTLKGPGGQARTIKVDPAVRGLASTKPGDEVVVHHTQAIAIASQKP